MKHTRKAPSLESGVSESVGFIIIFGIMMTGIALVTLYGYPALLQEQQNTNVRNMERNMIVLQNDLKSLTYKTVPYKETTLQVAGGTLSILQDWPVKPDPHFTVTWDGQDHYYYPGEIHFVSQDGLITLSLENGAVHTTYWSSPNGSAMLSEPRWFYDAPTKSFVMHFIRINASYDSAQTDIGNVRMKLIDSNTNVTNVSNTNVTIKYSGNITNNYNTAWKNYFSSHALNMTPVDISSNLESTFKLPPVNTLIIKTYNVTLLSL